VSQYAAARPDRLQTTAPPALFAEVTVHFHHHVTYLAGIVCGATHKLAIADDAAGQARSHAEQDEIPRLSPGAKAQLGHRRRVHVVVDPHRQAISRFQLGSQLYGGVDRHVHRLYPGAGRRIGLADYADPHRQERRPRPDSSIKVLDCQVDAGQGALLRSPVHRIPLRPVYRAILADRANQNLGSAYIHSHDRSSSLVHRCCFFVESR
jgi:hypothetical protein